MGEFSQDGRLELVHVNGKPSHYRERQIHGNVDPINETNSTYMQSATYINMEQYVKVALQGAKSRTSSSSEVSGSSLEKSMLNTPGTQSSRESTPPDSESRIIPHDIDRVTGMSSVHTSAQAPSPYGERLLPQIMDNLAATEPDRIVFSLASLVHGFIELKHISARNFAQAVDKVAWWLRVQVGVPDTIQPVAYIGPRAYNSQ